jgi:hypothetical protein
MNVHIGRRSIGGNERKRTTREKADVMIKDHRSIPSSNVRQAVPVGSCIEPDFFVEDAGEIL